MALHIPLATAARVSLSAARARAPSLATGGGACGARGVPPCPPCQPPPPPACRALPTPARRAQRVTCCAPPQGARPPCSPRLPACSLTCQQYLDQKREVSHQKRGGIQSRSKLSDCDFEQDPVARRIQLAKCARHVDYEREVMSRAADNSRARSPPPVLYRLGSERECAQATDGHLYVVPHDAPSTPRASCGPDRTPPPPRCVELAPDDACRIKNDAHLDPCAHRPRVMIEIDRSANATASKMATPALTTSSTSGGASGAPRTDVASWCANPPPPAPAPQPCRRPTIVERLRGRSSPHLPDSHNKRRFHTSGVLSKTGKSDSSLSGGLESVLRSKGQLKEAGLGRVVIDPNSSQTQRVKPAGGSLELCVPPGATRVAVQVSLDATPAGPCPPRPSDRDPSAPALAPSASNSARRPPSPCANSGAPKRDSWLSIKQIQKKWTGCQPDEGSSGPKIRGPSACLDKRASSQSSPLPCRKEASGSSRSTPSAPAPSGGSTHKSKQGTKRCSPAATLLANTIAFKS